MKNDEEYKVSIIKETVVKTIMDEVKSSLEQNSHADDQKVSSIMKEVSSQLPDILNSMSIKDLLPSHQVLTQEEFERHILKLIRVVTTRLQQQLKHEFNL